MTSEKVVSGVLVIKGVADSDSFLVGDVANKNGASQG